MNIPPANHPCWTKLANGVPGFTPKQLGLQLLFTRLNQEKQSIAAKATAIHAFFVKYELIVSQELSQMKALGLL